MSQTVHCRNCLLARLAALILWIVAILWLSLTPRPPHFGFSNLFSWDKLQHAGGFALLTLLAGRFYTQWRPMSRYPWHYALIFAVLFGGLIEILQGMLTDVRRAQWGDLAADALGGVLVFAVACVRQKLHGRK